MAKVKKTAIKVPVVSREEIETLLEAAQATLAAHEDALRALELGLAGCDLDGLDDEDLPTHDTDSIIEWAQKHKAVA